MRRTLTTLILAAAALTATATTSPETIILPGCEGDSAIMYVYPAASPCGVAIVGCPGGGYAHHAMGREGHDFAPWLNDMGIDYAVVKYRTPQGRHNVPADDIRKAICHMRRSDATVGVMGFSAGGHLASTVATHIADSCSRPDFQILFYPVITMDSTLTHQGTRQNLIGASATPEMAALYSNELHVCALTPEAIIFHCTDDEVVPIQNAELYHSALLNAGIDSQLHTYPTGGHGWGFRETFQFKPQWTAALRQWLQRFIK